MARTTQRKAVHLSSQTSFIWTNSRRAGSTTACFVTQALPLDRKYLNRKYVRSFGEPIVKFLLRHLRCVKLQEEAYILFRRNQHLNDPDEIAKKIDEGEKRYQIAWHYKIPYPRVHNLPLGAFIEKPETEYQIPSQEMGSLDDDLDDLPGLSKSRR
ncbi:uncharacterized protein [Physcomitrium patens]|nr:uncharacterized protein LOC112292172 isoform X1 [Physcomitrium patens]|eukprot:XP_024396160.1 uncharacterized protein LOC112292172 isoform X1 [Physcomitrella patens]